MNLFDLFMNVKERRKDANIIFNDESFKTLWIQLQIEFPIRDTSKSQRRIKHNYSFVTHQTANLTWGENNSSAASKWISQNYSCSYVSYSLPMPDEVSHMWWPRDRAGDIWWARLPDSWFPHVRLLWPRPDLHPAAALLPRPGLQGGPRAPGNRGQVLHGERGHPRGRGLQGDALFDATFRKGVSCNISGKARCLCRGIQMQQWKVSICDCDNHGGVNDCNISLLK